MTDEEPSDPAPPPLNLFTNPDELKEISPAVNQVFFIGNGRTNTNNLIQKFHIPPDATCLFLGFADSAFFGHAGIFAPCCYENNIGSLTADLTIEESSG